jgi:hypothetical protein
MITTDTSTTERGHVCGLPSSDEEIDVVGYGYTAHVSDEKGSQIHSYPVNEDLL